MSHSSRATCGDQLRRCDPQVILAAAALCDGLSILKPEALLHADLPQAVVDHVTATYRSADTANATIFGEGRAVRELRGVYGLDALRFFAAAMGVEYRRALGRGFEAAN